ncbi:YkgJ family cysteine cluster protein [Candidatus Dojkabacteria bacterium]|jgi:Fe-S-cluster containining protein|nr:YkgJ family cysteine cluster protein [Candidatus Dojkabacteria bacterium]
MAENKHQVKCFNKGKCCRNLDTGDGVYEFDSVAGGKIQLEVKNKVCQHLDLKTGLCTIYAKRPVVCADWYCKHCNCK